MGLDAGLLLVATGVALLLVRRRRSQRKVLVAEGREYKVEECVVLFTVDRYTLYRYGDALKGNRVYIWHCPAVAGGPAGPAGIPAAAQERVQAVTADNARMLIRRYVEPAAAQRLIEKEFHIRT